MTGEPSRSHTRSPDGCTRAPCQPWFVQLGAHPANRTAQIRATSHVTQRVNLRVSTSMGCSGAWQHGRRPQGSWRRSGIWRRPENVEATRRGRVRGAGRRSRTSMPACREAVPWLRHPPTR
ncbi:hypothetical protein Rhow_006713 [Rhodococcus wratislaviensis]|uniref:Uncharacterized protein n=1 Tax=Rhodococcus wratislaviensis TaxID=44752 RepID=A0A402CG95_RHOWR|nr:hypothetical protein Rhow_006713 [Rhodococcus wratislaviensis]